MCNSLGLLAASLKPPRVQPGPGAEQAAGDRRGEQLEARGVQGLRRGRWRRARSPRPAARGSAASHGVLMHPAAFSRLSPPGSRTIPKSRRSRVAIRRSPCSWATQSSEASARSIGKSPYCRIQPAINARADRLAWLDGWWTSNGGRGAVSLRCSLEAFDHVHLC